MTTRSREMAGKPNRDGIQPRTWPRLDRVDEALKSYLAEIDRFAASLAEGVSREALNIVRWLVDHMVVHPREKGGAVTFRMADRLATLIDPSVGSLVPRGGIEPPTLRFSVACSTN